MCLPYLHLILASVSIGVSAVSLLQNITESYNCISCRVMDNSTFRCFSADCNSLMGVICQPQTAAHPSSVQSVPEYNMVMFASFEISFRFRHFIVQVTQKSDFFFVFCVFVDNTCTSTIERFEWVCESYCKDVVEFVRRESS